MADKSHQFPAVFFGAVLAAKGRHAGKAHSVFDDPEEFAVAELLGFLGTQVRRLGLQIAADHGVSAAIIRMADGAVIGEVQASVAKVFGRISDGI